MIRYFVDKHKKGIKKNTLITRYIITQVYGDIS